MALGFETPLAADARMQDLLQRAFLSRVGEDYGPDRPPIQASGYRINRGAELLLDESPHLRVAVRQLPRCRVRIEKLGTGRKLAQRLHEARLPGGNPARYSDGWHNQVRRCHDLSD
jgi:hypothetical protein